MSRAPNIMDASTDLRRCIKAKIGDESYTTFFRSAVDIINLNIDKISTETKNIIFDVLKKVENENLDKNKKKDYLLTIASLLQIEYLSQFKNNSN